MQKVFSSPLNVLAAIFFASGIFFALSIYSEIPLLIQINSDPSISLTQSFSISKTLLVSFLDTYTPGTFVFTLTFSLLLSIYLVLLFHVIGRQKSLFSRSTVVGVSGSFLSFIGVGCAACGSLILGSIASTIGAGWVLAYLPYGGSELGIIGLFLLIISIYLADRTLKKPLVC